MNQRDKVLERISKSLQSFHKSFYPLYYTINSNKILFSHCFYSPKIYELYKNNDFNILKTLTSLWENGKISNYTYLISINIISGRTFSDLSQYPVFPWLLYSYDLEKDKSFNNQIQFNLLEKPLSISHMIEKQKFVQSDIVMESTNSNKLLGKYITDSSCGEVSTSKNSEVNNFTTTPILSQESISEKFNFTNDSNQEHAYPLQQNPESPNDLISPQTAETKVKRYINNTISEYNCQPQPLLQSQPQLQSQSQPQPQSLAKCLSYGMENELFYGSVIGRCFAFRDFSKPIGSLTSERLKLAILKYESCEQEKTGFPPFHYGSHYSSGVPVLYFLLRVLPFSEYSVKLQGGKFDLSDRLFGNWQEAWTLSNSVDYKELIPELFNFGEMFLNCNGWRLGETQMKVKVNDVRLPKWTGMNVRFFSGILRKCLENEKCAGEVHKWIDLIFGVKQRGKVNIDKVL